MSITVKVTEQQAQPAIVITVDQHASTIAAQAAVLAQEILNQVIEIFNSSGSGTVADATNLVKGKLRLAGDLGGDADNPVIVQFSQLEITGTEPRALMLNPDKTPSTDSIMEFEVYDEAGPYTTLAEIQAAYPSEVSGILKRPQGFQVWCVATTPVVMYKKYGDSDALWIMNDGSGWVKMT